MEVNLENNQPERSLESDSAFTLSSLSLVEATAAWNLNSSGSESAFQLEITSFGNSIDPNKVQAGTVDQFISVMNNSNSKIGLTRGEDASKALERLGATETINILGLEAPTMVPATTPYFNNKDGRYIYTEKGGWIDMVHFLFYAGRAHRFDNAGYENPIGEAVQEGNIQERIDSFFVEHSAYSYEDLPSDKYGAEFAVNHFDPHSKKTLGEQVASYLNNVLKATKPDRAPNYASIPGEPVRHKPIQNKSVIPMFTLTDE